MQKGFLSRAGPRGCDVALKGTLQRHAGPRGAYAALCDRGIIHIYRKYFVYRTYKPSDFRNYAIPLIPSHLINPYVFFNFLRVGLSSTRNSKSQDTWRRERRQIG